MATKKTLGSYIRDWITPSLLLGGILFVAWYGSEYMTQLKETTFDNSRQKIKVIDHTNEVPNAVDNYKGMLENIKQAKRLDSVYKFALDVFEDNSKNSEHAIKSRAKRDSINQMLMLNTLRQQAVQEEQTQTIKKILKKLDSIK